jgi:hypothetical protein
MMILNQVRSNRKIPKSVNNPQGLPSSSNHAWTVKWYHILDTSINY